jgi:hypothetical protein
MPGIRSAVAAPGSTLTCTSQRPYRFPAVAARRRRRRRSGRSLRRPWWAGHRDRRRRSALGRAVPAGGQAAASADGQSAPPVGAALRSGGSHCSANRLFPAHRGCLVRRPVTDWKCLGRQFLGADFNQQIAVSAMNGLHAQESRLAGRTSGKPAPRGRRSRLAPPPAPGREPAECSAGVR